MARRNHITRGRIRAGLSRAKNALGRLERYREAAKETMAQVVTAVEIGVSSFGFGWVKGRYGETDVAGVPIDLGFGAAAHLIGFTGLLGKDLSRHTHAFANGALGSYLSDRGRQIGEDMANESDSASGRSTSRVGSRRRSNALPQRQMTASEMMRMRRQQAHDVAPAQ